MISDKMKLFIEKTGLALVASADPAGQPHLAVGQDVKVPDATHLLFDAWFCPRTLENVAANPQVAVAVTDPATGAGYQLIGVVEATSEVGILDGYLPELEESGMPQVESRLVIRIDRMLEFSHGVHSDRAIALE